MKKPIIYTFDLNEKNRPPLLAIVHTDDENNDVLQIHVTQNGEAVNMTGKTVTARAVMCRSRALVSDNIACTVTASGDILIPFDNAVIESRAGDMLLEVNAADANGGLTLQFPLKVRVNGSILDTAQVLPDSQGRIPDLLQAVRSLLNRVEEQLERVRNYNSLDGKPQINGVTLSGDKTSAELGLQKELTAGENVTIAEDGTISASGADYSVITYGFHYNKNLLTLINNVIRFDANKVFKWINPTDNYFIDNSFPYNSFFVVDSEYILSRLSVGASQKIPVSEFGFWLCVKNDIFPGYPSYGEATEYGYYHNFYLTFTGSLYHQCKTVYPGYHSTTDWEKILDSGSQIVSGIVNQNGTITFTNSDGTTFTTTGASVIGKDGINVTGATINQQGHLIITLSDGTTIDAGWIGMPQIDISNAVVTLSTSEFIYDGTLKTPMVASVVLNGQTLTVGTDYIVTATPETNAGSYTVIVNGVGDYTGTATANWAINKAQATISGADAISVTGAGSTQTETYTTTGDGVISFSISAPSVATISNSGGSVTVTAVATGSATLTVTVADGVNYLGTTKTVAVSVATYTVFGVVWDYSLSSPALARLTPQNDPLGVVTNVPSTEPTACVGNDGNGQSDFDNYMPWAGMQRYNYVDGQVVNFVDYNNGETFVCIPEFWSKMVNDTANSKMYFYISSEEISTFVKHPGSGRYVSRFVCNDNFLSTSGFMPKVNTSLTDFRTGITAIDSKHFQYDFHTYNAIELLYIVEFAHLNSQAKIGAGITSGSAAQTTGQTDILTYHTGRAIGDDNLSAIQYRWIENLYGNVWNLVDGILIPDRLVYICNDRANYASSITNDYESTGLYTPITNNSWHKTDQDYNDCYLIPLTTGGSDSTYTCDFYYYSTGLRALRVGGAYGNNTSAGLFRWDGSSAPDSANTSIGGRSILILGGGS